MINDSGQIAATSSARLRALARVRRGGRASGRETIGDALVSGRGRAPVARNKGSASRPRGKFSSLQILENSQNAERISILREPAPQAQGTRCADGGGAARVGHAHDPSVLVRRVTCKTELRPEMAPQPLEKIGSGPEMVWSRRPRTHKIWYASARLTDARLRLTTPQELTKLKVAEKGAQRPEIARCRTEIGACVPPHRRDPERRGRAAAAGRVKPVNGPTTAGASR